MLPVLAAYLAEGVMTAGLLLALAAPLLGAAPPQDVYVGVEPARTFWVHPGTQARLRRTAGWRAFNEGEGSGWQARFDEVTGTVRRAWGTGIPLGPLRESGDAEGALRSLFRRWPDLVGVPAADLALRSARHVERTDTWYVDFDRLVQGVPVWRGGVTARVRFGNLVLLGVDTHPDVPPLGLPRVAEADARAVALRDGPASLSAHTPGAARLVVLPQEHGVGLVYRLAWEIRSRTSKPPGAWVSFVDAQGGSRTMGTLLSVHNEVRFLDGVIVGTHDTRTVDGDTTTSVLPYVTLTGSGGSTSTTGADGAFDVTDAETWTATLAGDWFYVTNEAGAEATLLVEDEAPTWTDAAATPAELATWVHLHEVREFGLRFAPELDLLTERLRAKVNVSTTCYAFYDGQLQFGQEGDGCNDLGRIADVSYHEWGHAFHQASLEAGVVDGTMGEGIGDLVAALQTLDPIIAPSFWTDGRWLREIDTDRVYPEDIEDNIHRDGVIFAGAAWDLFGLLQETYGEPADAKGRAWDVTSGLLADAIKAGPTLDSAYDEFVVADDDDGDLGNGTPHLCELVEAFGRHGLGPLGAAFPAILEHDAPGNQPADMEIAIDGSVTSMAPGCVEVETVEVDAMWSTDAGATWEAAPMTLDDEAWSGAMPALPAGTVVQYYIVARSAGGDQINLPDAPWAPYTFYVGDLVPVACEDFSTDDGSFSHEASAGAGEADDWQFGAPVGLAGDPDRAFSGANVWGNDLGTGDDDGAYPPSVVNRLYTEPLDLGSLPRVVIQYRRWLSVEDGASDHASIQANDVEIWSNRASADGAEHTEDAEWILHTFALDLDSASLVLSWGIDSSGEGRYGGWNLDDLCVYAPAGPDAWFPVADFSASDDEPGGVTLRWSQPGDVRATEALVLRREDRYPANAADGDIVYQGAIEPGAAADAHDPLVGTAYYAVFVGGAAGWTTSARAPYGADLGTGLIPEEEPPEDTGGDDTPTPPPLDGDCGCRSAGGGAANASWAASLALALTRRRRRPA